MPVPNSYLLGTGPSRVEYTDEIVEGELVSSHARQKLQQKDPMGTSEHGWSQLVGS